MAKSENLPVKAQAQTARQQLVQHYQGDLANLVGKNNVNRFVQNFYLSMIRNPDLAVADRKSLFLAVLYAAQRNLEIGVEDGVALLTFKGQVTPVVQYRALLKKSIESGALDDIKAVLVYSGDKFTWKQGTKPEIIHEPAPLDKDPGEVIGGYVLYKRPGIDTWFCSDPVRISDIHKVRNSSAAYKAGGGPWVTWYEEMCKKTVIRKAMKTIPAGSKILQLLEDEGRMDTGVTVKDILEEEEAITVEATDVPAQQTKTSSLAEQLKQKAQAEEPDEPEESPEPAEEPEPEAAEPETTPETPAKETADPNYDAIEDIKGQIKELATMAKSKNVPIEIINKKYSVKGWADFTAPDKFKLIPKVREYLGTIPDAK